MARQTKDINKDVIALVRQIQRLIPLLEADVLTGLMDAGNSTDEVLGAGGVFAGDWVLVGDRIQAAITIAVSAASAADGLVFEHSVDGSVVLHSHSYALQAGESRHFDEPLLCDYFRVVYTDGGAGGSLDLQTKLYKSAPSKHAHALSDAFNLEHPAEILRSVIAGFDAVGGTSKNVHAYNTVASLVALLVLLVDQDGTKLRFYTEDGAKSGNTVGLAVQGVRTDTLAAITPADGDWAGPLRTNNKGAWWVAIDGSVTISGTVTVSGTVTANAGTGWGASGLATEVTLAAVAASASVIDDWDESDRAKVNPIVGVAGVAAGAGSVGTTTQRVTHASDDPVTTAVQIMDDWDESDRCKVNPVAGVAGIAAGAGAGGANTTRTITATNSPDVTALEIMDDWDESDRAKVNPIAGQAGVQGASGVVTALTQRVVLATDVALPAGTNAIGKLAANSGVDIGDVDVTSLPITAAVLSTAFSVAAASASSTYATALASDEWRWLKIVNKTDTDFGISFDASTTHKIIPAGTGETLDLYANGLKITAAVSYKYLTAPTRGDFYVEGLAV